MGYSFEVQNAIIGLHFLYDFFFCAEIKFKRFLKLAPPLRKKLTFESFWLSSGAHPWYIESQSLSFSLSLAVHNFQKSTRKINSTDWRASVVRMTKNINLSRFLSIWRVPDLVITHTFSGSVPTRTGCILLLITFNKMEESYICEN